MRKIIDLTGEKFGRLTVMYRVENSKSNKSRWHCKCDCGNECDALAGNLKNGHTQSCGCYNKDCAHKRNKKSNEYTIVDDYIIAKTNNGIEFYIDIEDEQILKDYCWSISSNGYLIAYERLMGRKIRLHRLIMNCPNDMVVDHINGDTLDNRKRNLRVVTKQQNDMNKKIRSDSTSKVTGVYFHKHSGKWVAYICVENSQIHLGCFSDFLDAVDARKAAEEKYYGKFSYYNSRIKSKENIVNEEKP